MSSRLSRREFVKRASALSFMGAGAPFALNLATIGAASAQTVTDYRAIVCLFLFGGNDHTNTIMPYDPTEHAAYVNARQSIAFAYDALTPTATAPVASQNNRPFAFHPALTAFKQYYDLGKLAVVANVGPLVVPTTLAQYRGRSVPLPPKLFSHNDQQSVWQANQPVGEGARLGWGGRMGDLLASQNGQTIFTCISASGNAVFMSGQEVIQYQVGTNGSTGIAALSGNLYSSPTAGNAYRRLITRSSAHLFESQLGQVVSRSIGANATLSASLPAANTFTVPVPANNGLANQLNVVARIIAARGGLAANRQVFFVSTGGFDNHDFLLNDHNARMQSVNARGQCLLPMAAAAADGEQRDAVHRVRLRAHADQQRRRLGPRLGRAPLRARRRGAGRHHLRHVPASDVRYQRGCRAGKPPADDVGRPVCGDAGALAGRRR